CGACYFWFKSNSEEWMKQGKQVKEDAETFAASHTDEECLDSALERVDVCETKSPVEAGVCGGMVNVFLENSMPPPKQPAAVCEGVPKQLNIMEIATWAVSACTSKNRAGNQACARLMQSLQRTCMARLTKPPE